MNFSQRIYHCDMENSIWFHSLNKPFLNPPDWLFAPVWTVLYIMILISFVLFIRSGMTREKLLPLTFFIIQMALNLAWSPVFFKLHSISGALFIIILMWIFILLTIITFFKYSKMAALLLLPYLFWVSFAFYLNFSYFVMN